MKRLSLWTIRHRDEYDLLMRHGVLRASEEHIDEDFIPAYKWMRKQLASNPPLPQAVYIPSGRGGVGKEATAPCPISGQEPISPREHREYV